MFGIPTPIPPKGTLSVGVSGSLDGMDKEALFEPVDVGEKTTLIVQLDDGANVLPEQVSFCLLNLEASVPVIEIVPITRFALPVLETVKVTDDDELPTLTLPKL